MYFSIRIGATLTQLDSWSLGQTSRLANLRYRVAVNPRRDELVRISSLQAKLFVGISFSVSGFSVQQAASGSTITVLTPGLATPNGLQIQVECLFFNSLCPSLDPLASPASALSADLHQEKYTCTVPSLPPSGLPDGCVTRVAVLELKVSSTSGVNTAVTSINKRQIKYTDCLQGTWQGGDPAVLDSGTCVCDLGYEGFLCATPIPAYCEGLVGTTCATGLIADTCALQCPAGFDPSIAQVTCVGANVSKGAWSPEVPECLYDEQYCSLSSLPNGQPGTCNGVRVDSTCAPNCSPGYSSGSLSTCLEDATLSPVPSCENVDECALDPCAGQNLCIDTIGSFYCLPYPQSTAGTPSCRAEAGRSRQRRAGTPRSP